VETFKPVSAQSLFMQKKVHNFTVIIEKDEDGFYVGSVPALRGCHSQGKTIDELMENMREAIKLCLEVNAEKEEEFIGVQQIKVVR